MLKVEETYVTGSAYADVPNKLSIILKASTIMQLQDWAAEVKRRGLVAIIVELPNVTLQAYKVVAWPDEVYAPIDTAGWSCRLHVGAETWNLSVYNGQGHSFSFGFDQPIPVLPRVLI